MHSYGTMTNAEFEWWEMTGQHLVDTMAFSGSADVVGLLANKTVYAVYGDHGGAQKDVQRIPMAFYAKGIKHKEPTDNSSSSTSCRRSSGRWASADGDDGRRRPATWGF